MDDQNNPGGGAPTDQGGQTPPVTDQPAAPVDTGSTPQEEKCVTCGSAASGGSCVPCGQGTASCTCTPSGGSQPPSGSDVGGEQPQGTPTM